MFLTIQTPQKIQPQEIRKYTPDFLILPAYPIAIKGITLSASYS